MKGGWRGKLKEEEKWGGGGGGIEDVTKRSRPLGSRTEIMVPKVSSAN